MKKTYIKPATEVLTDDPAENLLLGASSQLHTDESFSRIYDQECDDEQPVTDSFFSGNNVWE